RGIKESPPYLHDGRLLTLEDTVEFFNLLLETKLADQDKKDHRQHFGADRAERLRCQLSPRWLQVLSRVVAPFRYPGHGFQMVASHIGQMAPSGRIVITAALQAADEMRRV